MSARTSTMPVARSIKIVALLATALFSVTAMAALADAREPATQVATPAPTAVVEERAPSAIALAPGLLPSAANPGAPRYVELDGSSHAPNVPRTTDNDRPAPISGNQLNPASPAPTASFEGAHNTVDCTVPPDADGAVGPTYYVSFVNNYNNCATGPGTGNVQFLCKAVAGNCTSVGQVKGAFYIANLYTGVSGGCSSATQHTDPQIVYDSAKDRYLIVDITTASPYKICVAASLSNDPLGGSWCVASVSAPTSTLPDYEKIGLWTDGLYIGTQDNGIGSSTTHHVVVVNKDDMESCPGTIRVQSVTMASDTSKTTYGCGTSNGHQGPRPATYNVNTGIPAPAQPEYIIGDYCLNNALFVDTLHVDWANSANTLLTKGSLTVQTTGLAPASVSNSGSDKMDTLRLELMPNTNYYKDGTGEYLFTDQTVQGSSSTLSAVAWYHLKVVNNTAGATVQNQGIWNPDATNRLDGAGAFDRNGNILMSYTQASSTLAPALAYAGRLTTDAANTFGQTETIAYRGVGYSGSCSGTCTRWGDYGSNFIDLDGCTFWFTGEVYRQTGDAWQWTTQVAAAQYPSCTPLTTIGSSTGSLSFQSSSVGTPTATQNVVVTNGGTGTLVLQGAALSGTNAADFAIVTDGCKGVALAAAGTCNVAVRYTPSTSSTETATVSVGDNTAAAHKLQTSLTGTVSGLTPPTTSAATSGTSGANGWFVSAVTVTLTCTPAANTTCASTWYTLDGGALTAYSGPVTISADATHAFVYNSSGSNGGTEGPNTLTVKIDQTPPGATPTAPACSSPGNAGWCKVSFQTITASASDATSGVPTSVCKLDGSTVTCGSITAGQGTHTVTLNATDLAGNVASGSLTVMNDATPPVTCSGSFASTAGTNGWFTAPGTETLTASDSSPGSGVASFTYTVDGVTTTYSAPFGISADGQHPITCQITDVAGNVGGNTSAGTVKIDTVPPTATETFTCGVTGTNGWCRDASRTVTTSATDATSGIGSQACTRDGSAVTCGSVTVNTQGTHTVCDTPTDLAGLVGTQTCATIKLDNVAPTASAGRAPAANAQGWNNVDVTVTFSCNDATSGIATCTSPDTKITEGAGQSSTGTATDNAGNTASVTLSNISIDKTAPSLTNGQSPAANGAGWNNGAVTVTFSCTDALSGVLTAPSNVALTSEGAGQSASGSCTDNAGNSASSTRSGVNIDLTAPSVSGSRSPAANGAGWNNVDVTASWTCTDATSGVASAPSPVTKSTEGAGQSATGTCTDVAGNSASNTVSGISIDKTAPTMSVTRGCTLAGNANWCRSGMTTTESGSDALSGIDASTYACTLDGNAVACGTQNVAGDGTHTAHGSVRDLAGNLAQLSQTFKLDGTAPILTATRTAANANGWNAGDVTVSYACTDATSGVSSALADDIITTEGAGQSRTGTCADVAGNSAGVTTSNINIDKTAPSACTGSYSGNAGNNGWFSSTGSETLTGVDALSGVASLTYALDGAASVTYATAFAITGDSVGHTVSCVVVDNAGNSVTLTASNSPVKIDTTPPNTCTGTFSGTLGSNGWYVTAGQESLTMTDATAGIVPWSVSVQNPAGGYFAQPYAITTDGSHAITCAGSDFAGNLGLVTASNSPVRLDQTPPSFSAHADVSAEAAGASGATVTYTAPTASDATSGLAGSVACSPASGTTFAQGSTTVTCSASDAAGNTGSTSFLVIVSDTTAPVVTVPADLTLEATSAGGATATFSASAQDAVDGALAATCAPASGSTFALGATTVTCSATDAAGNTGAATFRVTVVDTTAPAVTAPGDINLEAQSGAGAVATFAASASDAVDGAIAATCAPASGSTFAVATTTVTCTATDAAGNTGSASFHVTVRDTTPPAVTVPSDISLEQTSPTGEVATFAASADDIVDGSVAATCSPASGSTFAPGTTTVTCTATDAAGNSGSATFHVIVGDTTPPALTLPADTTREATSAAGASVAFSASALDAVDGARPVACQPASGSTFALGTTLVSCSADDASGNQATGTFHVTVVDTTPPTIDAADDITTDATTAAGAPVSFASPATHDLVDGDGAAVCAPASGSTFAVGSTTVTCSARDAAGNAASDVTFRVTVFDHRAPVIDAMSDIVAEATSAAGATVSFTAPATHDAVDGEGVATCAPSSGSTFALGDTLVSCGATDSNGNAATPSTFTVSVVDTTPPTIGAVGDRLVEAIGASGAPVTFATPDTHDAVDGDGLADCAPASGATFPLGHTLVTCTATDAHGNTASRSFTVTIVDTTPPTIGATSDLAAEAASASGAAVSFASPATSDAVDGAGSATCAPASGSLFALGATTVTCSATDAAGNGASSTFRVTVVDTTAPRVNVPPDVVAEASSADGTIVGFGASASDSVDGIVDATCSPSGGLFALGTTRVSCSATDAAGNAGHATFTVTIVDTTAPAIAEANDLTAEAASGAGAAVSYARPATTDAVDGAGIADCAPASGSTFALGAATVTCRATDAAGNAASSTFTMTVLDTTPPSLQLPSSVALPATSANGAVATFETSASDLVDGFVSVACTPASGSLFARGDTTVDCSATDAAGNTATRSFVVHVVTSVGATVSTAHATYAQADAILGGVTGEVHVAFPGGASAANAHVTLTVTRALALGLDPLDVQSFDGMTDANGDLAFAVDLPFELLGSYTLHADANWNGVQSAADGAYDVVAGLASGVAVADAGLLP